MPDALLASSALDVLLRRASVPPRLLRDPAPDKAALDLAVSAALRAPDHGGLRPWRFVLVEGEARRDFGDVLAASLALRAPSTPPDRLEAERAKPLRAPLLAVALTAAPAELQHVHPSSYAATAQSCGAVLA